MEKRILNDAEWSYMLNLLYAVTCADNLKDFSDRLLARLDRLIPFDQGFVGTVKIEGDAVGRHITHLRSNWEVIRKYDQDNLYDDPYYNLFYQDKSVVLMDTDARDEEKFKKSSVYQSFYAPLGLYFALRANFMFDSGLRGFVVLCNSERSGDFSQKSKRILELLLDNLSVIFYRNIQKQEKEANSGKNTDNKGGILADVYSLTKREAEVALLLANNYSNGEVCDKLHITFSTLNKHIGKLYLKTNANNRPQLTKMILAALKDSDEG